MSTIHNKVAALDAASLAPIVQQLLHQPTAQPISWQTEPISKGSMVGHVFRLRGLAQVEAQQQPWSVILKIIPSPDSANMRFLATSHDPGHFTYWKRECHLYQSELHRQLPPGLATPQVYQIVEQPNECWLWLEEVHDRWGEVGWPMEEYARTARHLGQWNGLYATTRPLPTYPWLTRDEGIARVLPNRIQPEVWPQLHEIWQREPLMRPQWPGQTLAEFERLWNERAHFLHTLAHLPKVLAHSDASRKNLMARQCADGTAETVLLDWGLVGVGPLGQELTALVFSTVFWLNLPVQHLAELDDLVFTAYLAGLRDVGWSGDAAQVRLGYVLYTALRCTFMMTPSEPKELRFDEAHIAETEKTWGMTMEELWNIDATLRTFLVARADEARRLMAMVVA